MCNPNPNQTSSPNQTSPPEQSENPAPATGCKPRVKRPDRQKVEMRPCCWDDVVPPDHEVRNVWKYVEGLDLSPLYNRIKAVEHHPGQSAIDPALLFALWLYATLRGIGSARELDRRCTPGRNGEIPFLWLCGDVSVNYHTLAEWRQRMATEEGKETYKERSWTSECVHAIMRNRGGLYQFRVRGRPKVRAVMLWHVLAHNLMRLLALCPQLVGAAS